jgi:hypothetical protein
MTPSHLTAAFVFALAVSVVFGVTSRNTDRGRLHYGLLVFAMFLVITVGVAWLMYFIRR